MSDSTEERYGLSWAGKQSSLHTLDEAPTHRLVIDHARSIGTDATAANVFVEGDNLEVLKLLRPEFHGRGPADLQRPAVQHDQAVRVQRRLQYGSTRERGRK